MDAAGHHAAATVYPETDAMGEHETQRYIAELLRALIVYWFALHKRVAHVGANQFVYRLEGHPEVSRAPDVYVIEGLPQDHPDQTVWKTWEGHVPVFALEVVSARWHKDYDDAPADYDAMGTRELVLFDPGATQPQARALAGLSARARQASASGDEPRRSGRVALPRLRSACRERAGQRAPPPRDGAPGRDARSD